MEKIYTCKSKEDVFEKLKEGRYVFTYVSLKDGSGIKYINAYHLCDYGLEAFSFDRNKNDFPLELKRADVHYPDNIENFDEMVKAHIAKRYPQFAGFLVCDSMLDLDNIQKPCRFSPFPKLVA